MSTSVADRRRRVKPPSQSRQVDQGVEQLVSDVCNALGVGDEMADRLSALVAMLGADDPRIVLWALSQTGGPASGYDPMKADTTMRYLALSTDAIGGTMTRLAAVGAVGIELCGQCRRLLSLRRSETVKPTEFGQAAQAVAYRAARDAAARLLETEAGHAA